MCRLWLESKLLLVMYIKFIIIRVQPISSQITESSLALFALHYIDK